MAFEGSEHIINIIEELRDIIDVFIIGYQKRSYHGSNINDFDMAVVSYLKENNLADIFLEVETDLTKEARVQETDKRNMIIQAAEDAGCSHCLVIDADEFYNKESFLQALTEIDNNDYEQTYCQYVNYYGDYSHYMVYPFKNGMYVPFVTKTCYRFKYSTNDFPLPSDPTRRYERIKGKNGEFTPYHVFLWHDIKMHHLSWVRKNIFNKLKAWSSRSVFNDIYTKIEVAIQDWKNFIQGKKGNEARIIFNTPGNKIQIKEFPKQYITPKYSVAEIDDMVKPYYKPREKQIVVLNMSTDVGEGLFSELEETCYNTWYKRQKEQFGLDNITYYGVYPGEENKIEGHNIFIKDIQDDREDVFQMFHRFTGAVRLLKAENINFDYIIRTNTSAWLNLPLLNGFLKLQEDERQMFGFRLESAFWSQYNPYLQGQLLIMSDYTAGMMVYNDDESHYSDIKNVCDDVLFGAVYSTMKDKTGIPHTEYLKSLHNCRQWWDGYDNLPYVPALQVKDFKAIGFGERKMIEPGLMEDVQKKFEENHYFALDEAPKILDKKKDEIWISIIEDTKKEWLPKDDEYKKNARFNEPKFFKDSEEMIRYINNLKIKGEYLI